jgi:putative Ca2+/H+ antiporter (TMEM165/GDT1 family)
MAAWTLIPDKLDEDEEGFKQRGSAFVTTLVSFFLVEMGDKTQIATIALAARYQSVVVVTIGTTLGMMIANIPAVYLGEIAARRLPLTWIRRIAAGLFFVMAVAAAFNIGQLF